MIKEFLMIHECIVVVGTHHNKVKVFPSDMGAGIISRFALGRT